MSRRRIAAAITSVVLAITGAVAAPTVAHADDWEDDYCSWQDDSHPWINSYGPSTVTVGLQPKLVSFWVSAGDDCGIDDWRVDNDYVWAYKSDRTAKIYTWSNSDAGKTYMDVKVWDTNYNATTERFGFRLKRATYVSGFNVTPEPVKKGKYVTVKGTLKRADWTKGKYVSYGAKSQRVQIQFKAKGSSTYKTIKTVTLGKKSAVKTKIKVAGAVAKDGTYRLAYAGNGTSGASVSVGDYVDVK